MDANDDKCTMDEKEDESNEDSNGIVNDQHVLTNEGGDRKNLIKKLYDYCIGMQSHSDHSGPPSEQGYIFDLFVK